MNYERVFWIFKVEFRGAIVVDSLLPLFDSVRPLSGENEVSLSGASDLSVL